MSLRLRPFALIMPEVTEPVRPNGAPKARTLSPISDASESPNSKAGRFLASILTMARSVLGSPLISVEVNFLPSFKVISTLSAPSTTWLLVTITPLDSTIKPDPNPPWLSSGPSSPPRFLNSSKNFLNSSGICGLSCPWFFRLGPCSFNRIGFAFASMLTTEGSTFFTTSR